MEFIYSLFSKWLGHYINLNPNMKNLKRKIKDLSTKVDDVETELRGAEHHPAKRPRKVAQHWCKNVQDMIESMQRLEEEVDGLGQWMFVSRALLGKHVEEKIQDVVELQEQHNFPRGVLIDAPPTSEQFIPTARFFRGSETITARNKGQYLMDDERGLMVACMDVRGKRVVVEGWGGDEEEGKGWGRMVGVRMGVGVGMRDVRDCDDGVGDERRCANGRGGGKGEAAIMLLVQITLTPLPLSHYPRTLDHSHHHWHLHHHSQPHHYHHHHIPPQEISTQNSCNWELRGPPLTMGQTHFSQDGYNWQLFDKPESLQATQLGYFRTYGGDAPQSAVYKHGVGPSLASQALTMAEITQQVWEKLMQEQASMIVQNTQQICEKLKRELRAELTTHIEQMTN
ncbi:hypothetical protein TEA_010608 [Camellia sinensis var. sinensis]|uniref:Uncharacterized protein n=1 Tax=Camellia sinensis var. sinensis TaxID=542762 RepID=A0A4S4D9L0_CAMSN|nr:hypothetical protein TEA_010608 [Camellia sinensis var. sinensis]